MRKRVRMCGENEAGLSESKKTGLPPPMISSLVPSNTMAPVTSKADGPAHLLLLTIERHFDV